MAKGKKSGTQVVLASRIKEVAKKAGLRVAGDFVAAANAAALDLLGAATRRAKGNKRGTLRPQDL